MTWRHKRALTVVMFTMFTASMVTSTGVAQKKSQDVDLELNRLVVERGTSTTVDSGILRVRKNGGWARTRRIISDFVLTGEFRLDSSESELHIGIRTLNTVDEWPRRGYRLRLSSTLPVTCAASGYRLKHNVGTQVRLTTAEWHTFKVTGTGKLLEVVVDGQAVGTCEIDALAGAILFQTERGDAELRGLDLQNLWPSGIVRLADYKGPPEITPPSLRREVKPNYSRNAMAAKVQGVVNLEGVVLEDGSVGAIRLTSLLHPELEHTALEAVRQWRFAPAILKGVPIATIVEIEMSFTLE